jgi:HemY protein
VRLAIWFVLLFAVAVVAAATLGANDGLASFYWGGWRLDLSLNFFVLMLVGTCFLLVAVIQAINSLTGLPQRAREWRTARRDRTGQAALRDALAQYFGGRYTRAQKAAQRALAIQAETPELAQDNEFTVLGHLLAAGSAHRLQNRTLRDEELRRALELSQRSPAARSAEEGARLLAAEWALDDRDAPRAIELLNALPQGVARRTHALRLKLQAARLGRQPQEALKTARLLIKHQGFSTVAAAGLVRSLAFESLDAARDIDQLRPALDIARSGRPSRPVHRARAASQASTLGATTTRAPGCGRSGTASPRSRRRTAGHRRGACRRRAPASAPNGCRASKPRRRRCRATARSRSPPAARSPRAASGEGEGTPRARPPATKRSPRRRAARPDRARRTRRTRGRQGRAARCYESAARLG